MVDNHRTVSEDAYTIETSLGVVNISWRFEFYFDEHLPYDFKRIMLVHSRIRDIV